MLTSLIVIHLLKSDTWHYEDFWTICFSNYWSSLFIMTINDGLDYDMWHNNFFATWHINFILEYIYILVAR
jgi:hypothetical protein